MQIVPNRVLLIANPASRRGRRALPKAIRAFTRAAVPYDVEVTTSPGHGARIAAERGRAYGAVFTLGGDGTAMEVLGALAGLGPPVGVLPGGTGNTIARSLRTPLRISKAIPALLAGDEARIDLGRLASGERFAIGMGVGLDAAMIANAPPGLKRRLGYVAYVLSAARALLQLEKFTVRLTVDGKTLERTASAVLIANFGAVLNDLITFGDGIRRDDGQLNACVYSPGNRRDALRILMRMLRKNFSEDPCISYMPGSEFRLETDPPQMAQADGELLGTGPFELVVEPLAGRVLVPKR